MTILIVDDSRIMRNLIKNYCTDLDISHCTYVEAEDGSEAFKVVQTHEVDLIFLDWNMPKLLGIDFLRLLRKIDKYKHLPVIMVTSEIAKANVIEALKYGATDYIIKPIDKNLFRDKVLKALKK